MLSMRQRPFTIDIATERVEELRRRLSVTRWPNGVVDETGGYPLRAAEKLAAYWMDTFDWSRRQQELNQLPQVLAEIGNHSIHFVHVRSRNGATRLPVLLLHGWPGSFVELLDIAQRLSQTHDVVVPSIPGFGFSSAATTPGLTNRTIAALMAQLMLSLGYSRFAMHGGDIGAGIASWIAADFPQHVAGLHLNFIPGSYSPNAANPSDEERAFLQQRAQFADEGGAYAHMQRTKPLTLAYGLSDSPAGLMAWIAEKFSTWSDPSSVIPNDTLLTNVAIYWFTNTIGSSVRYYLESAKTPLTLGGETPGVSAPTAVAVFPFEIVMPPRSWVERGYRIVRWTQMPRGGHFAALEQPAALSADIKQFIETLD
jgi:pimeloyl-ACP methyl ester carboxylesterase